MLDIASDAGLDKNTQDLGKTLGKWGVGTGAYVVWPVLGPSSLRDSLALPVDMRVSAPVVFDDGSAKTAIGVLGVVNARQLAQGWRVGGRHCPRQIRLLP